jgi:hypothetical protein
MKYVIAWVIFLLVSVSELPSEVPMDQSGSADIEGTFEFSMSYRGLPAAGAEMNFLRESIDGVETVEIESTVRTKSLFKALFNIDNYYLTLVNATTGLPLKCEKKIEQKNIRQHLLVEYDRDSLMARSSLEKSWPIPADCLDLFSMIYRMRTGNYKPGQQVEWSIDIEGQLWRVTGLVMAAEPVDGPFADLPVRSIELIFSPLGGAKPRLWKTDLLTNRIARKGSVLKIYLGPPPQSYPLKLQFGEGTSSVEMKLEHVRSKSTL